MEALRQKVSPHEASLRPDEKNKICPLKVKAGYANMLNSVSDRCCGHISTSNE